MLGWLENSSQGWYLATLSSLLCVLGCFIIFLDDAYYFLFPRFITSRFPFRIKENYAFMNGSLAFSCGCLLITALYRLLPEAMTNLTASGEKENATVVLVCSFIGGIFTCLMFNYGMHLLTAESVVHCSHGGEGKVESVPHAELRSLESHENHYHQHFSHDHEHSRDEETHENAATSLNVASSDSHPSGDSYDHRHGQFGSQAHEGRSTNVSDIHEELPRGQIDTNALESQPLLARKKSSGLVHFLTHGSTNDESLLGECKGYSSAERCVYDRTGKLHYCEIPQLGKVDEDRSPIPQDHCDVSKSKSHSKTQRLASNSHKHHDSDEHHHHHVNSPFSRLLLIGIQTIFAITLHKLPEGFITYITSETNPQLGLSIFFSLLIHNYTEGFLMCLPLYYSFGNVKWRKLKAVGISATLGALSQPLGAFLGYLFMSHYGQENFDVRKLNFVFGISMAVTGGFLTVIALSMYGSSVSFSARPNFVLIWCLIGMCTIGLLTIFTND